MNSSISRRHLRGEAGYTLVELIAAFTILSIILGGLASMFVSAQRANTDADARMQSQQSVRLAFDRLEYDARCAQSATLKSSGQGVYLVIPSQCAHSTGNVTWCVNSGSLVRIVGSSCSTAGMTFVTSVTSATPFSCYTPAGVTSPLPQLKITLTVNTTTRSSNQTSATDYITMHNAATGQCS
jgi:Tfp pilus assembly protein PilW